MVGATTLEVAKSPVPKTGGLPLTLHPEEKNKIRLTKTNVRINGDLIYNQIAVRILKLQDANQ